VDPLRTHNKYSSKEEEQQVNQMAMKQFAPLFYCVYCNSAPLWVSTTGHNQHIINCSGCRKKYPLRRRIIQHVTRELRVNLNWKKPPLKKEKIKVTRQQIKKGNKKLKQLRQPPKQKNSVFLQVRESNLKGLNGTQPMKQGKNRTSLTYLMFDGQYYKIGMAQDPEARRKNLETSPGVKIKLIETSAYIKEKTLHKTFRSVRVKSNPHLKEWFDLGPKDLSLCLRLMRGEGNAAEAAELSMLTKKQGKARLKTEQEKPRFDDDIMKGF